MKILTAFGIVLLNISSMLLSIISKIVSVIAGPFIVFVIGCSIYCLVTFNWKSLVILAVLGGAIFGICMLIGLLQGLVDTAYGRRIQMK